MVNDDLSPGDYTLEVDILSQECTSDISLISKEEGTTVTANKSVSTVNNNWQHISVNNSITSGQTFQILIGNNSGTTNNKPIYIDNISLIKVS